MLLKYIKGYEVPYRIRIYEDIAGPSLYELLNLNIKNKQFMQMDSILIIVF